MHLKSFFKKKETLIPLVILGIALCLIIALSVGIPLSQETDTLKKANNFLDKYILLDG